MTTFTSIFLAVLALAAIFIVVGTFIQKRESNTHEKVKSRYIYRDEPHADSTTEAPNRLRDNDITKG